MAASAEAITLPVGPPGCSCRFSLPAKRGETEEAALPDAAPAPPAAEDPPMWSLPTSDCGKEPRRLECERCVDLVLDLPPAAIASADDTEFASQRAGEPELLPPLCETAVGGEASAEAFTTCGIAPRPSPRAAQQG